MKKLFNSFLTGFLLVAIVFIPIYQTDAILNVSLPVDDGYTSGGSSVTVNTSESPFTFSASLDKTKVNEGNVNINSTATVRWSYPWNMQYLYPTAVSTLFPYRRYFMASASTLGSSEDYRRYVSNGSVGDFPSSLITIIEDQQANEGYLPLGASNQSEMNITITKTGYSQIVSGDSVVSERTLSSSQPTYIKTNTPIANMSNLTPGSYQVVFKANPYIYVLEEGCSTKWRYNLVGGYSVTESDKKYCGIANLGARNYTFYKRSFPTSITIPFTVSPAQKITFTSVSDNKISTQPITLFDSITQKMIKGAKYGSNNVKISWQADNIIDSTNMVCTTPKGTESMGIISGDYLLPADLKSSNTSSVSCVEGAPYVPPASTSDMGCYIGTLPYGTTGSGGSINYMDSNSVTQIIGNIWDTSQITIHYKTGTVPYLTNVRKVHCIIMDGPLPL